MRAIRALPILLLFAAALSCQADVPSGLPGCGNNCGTGVIGGGGGGQNTVQVRDNYYSPSAITVHLGDTVTWSWVGSSSHSVTFPSGGTLPDLGVHLTGSISLLMAQSGVYNYYCTVHGASVMSGTVTVQ
jgi:plastocyanin